jgi:hypothetical protein
VRSLYVKQLTVWLIISLSCSAQTIINGGRIIVGPFDASGASKTAPFRIGADDPVTCDPSVREFFFNTGTNRLKVCTATNTWSDAGGEGMGSSLNLIPRPAIKKWTYVTDASGGVSLQSIGEVITTSGNVSRIFPDNTNGLLYALASNSTIGSNMGLHGEPVHRVLHDPYVAIVGKIDSIANIRVWAGWSTNENSQDSDSPAGTHLAAFRYSTDAGDTHWMCATKDGATLNAVDSGLTPSTTAAQLLEIQIASGTN